MAICLNTEDKLEYVFYPIAKNQIQFRVKALNDAHVALTTAPNEGEPMYEIFIGGWSNSKSVIRKNRTKPDVAEADTPDILSADEHRGFWIRWGNDTVTVGKEGEPEPFLSFTDPEPFEFNHFGVCTGWGACGDWMVEDNPTPSAPSEYQALWCDAADGFIPPGALEAGMDDGEVLYVGRAQHSGALIPGKIRPSHGVCYVPWGGGEHGNNEYQVLCVPETDVEWILCDGGNMPPKVIPAGESEDGEPLFVGRTSHEGNQIVGKVQPSHGVIYIPYGGEEVSYNEFEVLVSRQ